MLRLRTGAGLALAVLGSSPALALDVACTQWNVSGEWTAIQSNHQRNSKGATFDLQQTGTQFKGSARYKNSNGVLIKGPVVGTVVRNAYSATIYWDDNRVGVYTGEIGPQGLVVGRTFDKNDPKTSADWHAHRSFDCLTAAPPSVAFGRVPSSAPALAATPGSICDAAKAARSRNSPAATGLEQRCRAHTVAATVSPATAAAPVAAKRPAAHSTAGPAKDPLASRAAASPPIETRSVVDDKGIAAALLATPALRNQAAAQSPMSSARTKADAVSLNPQPLPPASPLVLPTQAPSALR